MRDHFDRVCLVLLLIVFLALLAIFHKEQFEVAFLEHSADLILGALLGLVTNQAFKTSIGSVGTANVDTNSSKEEPKE
jgi:hypothetical protein